MKKHITLFVSFVLFPFLPVALFHFMRMHSNDSSLIEAAKHGLVVLGVSVSMQYIAAYIFASAFDSMFFRKPIYTALFGVLSFAVACFVLIVVFSPDINVRTFPAVIMFGAFSGVLAYHAQAKFSIL